MSEESWREVDAYVAERLLAPEVEAMAPILRANGEAGLPAIDVSAAQGKFLALLVAIAGARRVLEIGTLGGYSSVWMAKALPAGGRLVSLEYSAKHAVVARENFRRAGVADRIDLHIGAALDILPTLAGPFDLIFIDADKPNNARYLDWALRLGRPGAVVVLDNVVRGGGVLDANSSDPSVAGTRAAFDLLGSDPRFAATALQTVGQKGWDGFALAVIRAP